ncbi:hypothetical protein ACFOLF_19385 [Paenibacillus sepulcri]
MRTISFTITAMLAVVIIFALTPASVRAYSYGDANTEDVAETFKLVVADLTVSPVDWKGVEDAHKARRSEIASHFGEEVVAELDADIASRDAELLTANYKALLVMNLDRRFESVIQSIDEYTQAKLLLAKAKATFEVLKPYAEAKLTKEQTDGITDDFQKALDAIGNPGLFGVGQLEADPEALKTTVNRIYDILVPLFPYSGKPGTGQPTEGDAGNAAASPGEGSAGGETIQGNKEHAPMERTEKTNAGVTIGVIGGVAVVGICVVWWARRKGIF